MPLEVGVNVIVRITRPGEGELVQGPTIEVAGFATAIFYDGSRDFDIQIDSLEVTVDGSACSVTYGGGITGNWSATCTVAKDGPVTITATATAHHQQYTGTDTATRSVTVEIPPPPTFEFAAWVRLEPRCRSNDFARGLEARTADPLWMLARQWQTGEFQGEDAGSPIRAEVTYATQRPDHVRLGRTGPGLEIANIPLEMVVEKESFTLDWRARVQVGKQFERLIRTELGNTASDVINAFRSAYPIEPTSEESEEADRATRRFLQLMAERVIDGKTLLEAIELNQVVLPDGISDEQLDTVLQKLDDWHERLYGQPVSAVPNAWRNEQLDYRFELNPSDGATTEKTHLVAPSYRNGALDWYSFNVAGGIQVEDVQPTLEALPTRISVSGASPRWWAFEDANVNFGNMDVAKPDLATLLLMEFALIYADDWFSVPLPLQMPNLVKINELQVFNVFGEPLPQPVQSVRKNVLKKIDAAGGDAGDPLLRWEMFTLSPLSNTAQPGVGNPNAPGVDDVLFVPPVTGFREESPPIEEVRFLRDEGANLIWAVEHTVPNGLGRAVDGFDAQRERTERHIEAEITRLENGDLTDEELEAIEADPEWLRKQIELLRHGPRPSSSAVPRYRLATIVPDNWIPFIPYVIFMQGQPSFRLHRAQMLRNEDDERPTAIAAMSRLLDQEGNQLLLLEEASVPRSGLRVQLTAQRVRWVDGKTYVWLGRKVLAGRGEGSSGLRFDMIK